MELSKKMIGNIFGVFLVLTIFFFTNSAHGNEGQVDDETCLQCHDGMEKTLSFTAHRLSSQIKNPTAQISCSSCHKGGATHIEDPSVDNITNPAKLSGYDAVKVCTQCHQAHVGLDNYGFDAHTNQQLNCDNCHKVHSQNKSLLLDDKADFCIRCHTEKATNFALRSNHPVKQNDITCLSCHKFTKRQNDNLAYDLNRICQDCHPQEGGPFLYEHDATNAYSVEGGGCIACHEPHGSENNFLLKQKNNQVCLQCHFPSGHYTAHGGIWSKYSCVSCHTDVHGSFNNKMFLDPDLPAKFNGNCYNGGCHILNK